MKAKTCFFDDGAWVKVERCHPSPGGRHYSRQTVGAREFMSSGVTLVLLQAPVFA